MSSTRATAWTVRRSNRSDSGPLSAAAQLFPGGRGASQNRLTRVLTEAGCHVALSSSLHGVDISRTRSQALRWRSGSISRGPVLFKQVRVGKDGELFEMFKLRTMVRDAEALRSQLEDHNECSGALFKMRSDPRVTRVGRFLRKSSIDELPQLWNVMRGEMSIVGPRPALPAETEQWTADLHERLRVLPGITGMWQVSGRSEADFELYRRLDLYYVDNWSLTHDIKIVLKTIFVVLTGSGAH